MLRWIALLAVCACAAKSAPCPVAPAVAPSGAPLLWRVSKDGGATVWLYGTIHDAGLAAVQPSVLVALATSKRFASELGDAEPDKDAMRELSRIERGPGIDQQLSADDWWDLRNALRGKIREDDLRRARPWYALILLNRTSAPKTESMDVGLARTARQHRQSISGLETAEDQIRALDRVVTIADLTQAIRTRKTLSCAYTGLLTAYAEGDLAALEPMLVIPRTAESMLWARNRRWLPAIESFAADGGGFIAVGLGHLIGDQGLPALLAKAGYTVERAPVP
ncbi:MAG: TraB/GumN family protein [Deltaproteobacteria bacterium]|nr:TraB/GumN family protein [Deltaproteobacteria bacterium]